MIPASYFFKSYDEQWWLDQFEPKQTKTVAEKRQHGIPKFMVWLAARLHHSARAAKPAHICSET